MADDKKGATIFDATRHIPEDGVIGTIDVSFIISIDRVLTILDKRRKRAKKKYEASPDDVGVQKKYAQALQEFLNMEKLVEITSKLAEENVTLKLLVADVTQKAEEISEAYISIAKTITGEESKKKNGGGEGPN